jgi:peptide/nickel transport system permease protein
MKTTNLPKSSVAELRPKEKSKTWQAFQRHRLALISAVVLLSFIFIAVFADFVSPYDPNVTNTAYARGKPQPPSMEYILGTDNYGRDYLSRTISSIRISLLVGLSAVAFQLLIGLSIGILAGYLGGLVDNILMRITDIFLAIPAFMLLLSVTGILGGSLPALIFAIGALNWMTVARLVRAQILSVKEQEYIMAARCLGASDWRIISSHLIPNIFSSIIVAATLSVPSAILTESALSFLGLGVPPPNASLGNMLAEAQQWVRSAWWVWVVPGTTISMIVLAFNFIGDGLRDALDPRLQ